MQLSVAELSRSDGLPEQNPGRQVLDYAPSAEYALAIADLGYDPRQSQELKGGLLKSEIRSIFEASNTEHASLVVLAGDVQATVSSSSLSFGNVGATDMALFCSSKPNALSCRSLSQEKDPWVSWGIIDSELEIHDVDNGFTLVSRRAEGRAVSTLQLSQESVDAARVRYEPYKLKDRGAVKAQVLADTFGLSLEQVDPLNSTVFALRDEGSGVECRVFFGSLWSKLTIAFPSGISGTRVQEILDSDDCPYCQVVGEGETGEFDDSFLASELKFRWKGGSMPYLQLLEKSLEICRT